MVHIRRGDVNPNKYPNRYVYNKYYIDLLKCIISEIKEKSYQITIISEKNSYEPFDNFKEFKNIQFDLDTNTISNWKKIINSDIFIMSKSSYSYTPALFCRGIVIYINFWCPKINDWLLGDSNNFKIIFNKKLKIKLKCYIINKRRK